MYTHDYQLCKCGEIAVDGGKDYHRVLAKDWANFLRVDDDGNEIIPSIIDKEKTDTDNSHDSKPEETKYKPSKKELIVMIEEMIKSYENLPQNAMTLPITHYDLLSLMLLLSALFKAED
jgi:hypothetical protein